MTVLPMLSYQINQVLPNGKPIFIHKLLKRSPLFEQFKARYIFEIYCSSEQACGYIIQKGHAQFDDSDTLLTTYSKNRPFYLIDTLGNSLINFEIQSATLFNEMTTIHAQNGQYMGTIVKNFSLFKHSYTLYNAYESKMAFVKASKYKTDVFEIESISHDNLGSFNSSTTGPWSVLIDAHASKNVLNNQVGHTWTQSEKMILIATAINLQINHFS